ncbi:MAG: Flp family type IVb pilin [Alphaproteobacteria bacterium PA3]|nr:MAG: Flp family type IVb pilin [Alphaproteobacteria bacterium PA3]
MILKKLKNERGATAIEYGLIAALMVIVMIPALQMVGGNTNGMYDQVTNKIVAAMASAR